MNRISQSSVGRERKSPQKLYPSPDKAIHRPFGAREISAGDNSKTTNNYSQRIEELENLISRLNNGMLTLEEENLKLHKRLRVGKLEANGQEAATDHNDKSGGMRAFSPDKTAGDSSATSLLQGDGYSQLKIENNMLKKKLKEAEKCSKQCCRDLQKLLQKCEELKAQNQILEQHSKQLAMDKKALDEKLCSLRTEMNPDERMRAATRMSNQTGGCSGRIPFDNEGLSSLTTGQGSDALHDTLACLKEENQVLKEELRQSTERSAQAEERAQRMREEHAVLENCLRTVQQEKDLLQVEVRALHQDYMNLSDSITLQLRERANESGKASEAGGSSRPSTAPNQASAAFREGNSKSTELKESIGARRSTGSVTDKAVAMRRCTSSDSINLPLKDKGSGKRRSIGCTPGKVSEGSMRTCGQETKASIKGNPTQADKQDQIDKDTIEKIRIRFEEELKKARLKIQQ